MKKEQDIQVIINDFATERIPMEHRRSTLSVSMVAAGFCISMSGLFTGAALSTGLNFKQAVISAIVGNLILSVYGGLVGVIGTKEGLSASRLAIFSFGKQGFKIVAFVVALTMAGWFSVQAGLFGKTINAMFPSAGIITTPKVATLWGGILMLITAVVGIKGLSLLSNIAVPAITICASIGMFVAVKSVGGWSNAMLIQPVESWATATGIVAVVGSFAAGASAQADIARYSKTTKTSLIATTFGYSIANTFIILAGYLTTLTTGNGDLPEAMLHLGLGMPALLVLILAQWTTNDNNLYTSSLGLSNIIRTNRSYITIFLGVIGSIVGALGIADYFTNFLGILGVGIPPMAGIIICDYYIINKMNYNHDINNIKDWRISAIIAWLAGGIVGFTVHIGIASINSLIIALIVYYLLNMNQRKDERND